VKTHASAVGLTGKQRSFKPKDGVREKVGGIVDLGWAELPRKPI
jgi:hypothetical protein